MSDLAASEGEEGLSLLRISVAPGGCSGLRYQLALDDRELEGDIEKEWYGVKVVTDRMSAPTSSARRLTVDTIQQQGFTIDNPNAGGSCACGDSFTGFGTSVTQVTIGTQVSGLGHPAALRRRLDARLG